MTEVNQQISVLKKHILKYAKTTNLLAWQALGTTIMLQVLAIYLLISNQKILGWALQILTHVRFFVQFHDIGHFAFFESISLNKFFGTILGIYMHIPFQVWREEHNNHHKDFGNLDKFDVSQSVLFTKKQYEEMSPFKRAIARTIREPLIFFLIVAPVAWFLGLLIAIAYKHGIFSLNVFQKLLSTFIFFCVLPLLGVPAVQLWVSLYITLIIGVVMFHLQHAVNTVYRKKGETWNTTQAAIQGSTYLQVPLLLKPFFAGIQYHHIHHLNTNVPTYLIQQCYQSFEKQNHKWEDYKINKVDYWKAIKSLVNVMYDEESKLLIPFCYKFW